MTKPSIKEENEQLRKENERVTKLLRECLKELRSITQLAENWAYGPLFKKAGVQWPDGRCNAPALVSAERWLKQYYQEND